MPPRIPELTLRQEEALRVYRRMTEKNDGITPTVREFAEKLGGSRTAAHQLLMHLREKGYLKMPPITQTRIRFTAKGKKAV
jgi:SOS-response transcriptional repressor LexA